MTWLELLQGQPPQPTLTVTIIAVFLSLSAGASLGLLVYALLAMSADSEPTLPADDRRGCGCHPGESALSQWSAQQFPPPGCGPEGPDPDGFSSVPAARPPDAGRGSRASPT